MPRALRSVFFFGLCLPAALPAQEWALSPQGRFPRAFQRVGGVRPLPGGRVLVADPSAGVLAAIDFEEGGSDPVGGAGGGRGASRTPCALLPLPGDSTLLVDRGLGQMVVVDPVGELGRAMPIAREGEGGQMEIVLPRFTDDRGRIYYPREVITGGPVQDSTRIMLFDPSTNSVREVASVGLGEAARRRGGSISLGRRPLAPADDWAVAPDGRVAMVRAEGYVVEWLGVDGSVSRGVANPVEPETPGQAEKSAWFREYLTQQISTGIRRAPDGRRQVTLRIGSSTAPPADLSAYDWPESLPAFRVGRSLITPAGALWVQRHGREGARSLIDVFDGEGRRVGGVELLPNRRVVAFGPDGTVYVAHRDGENGEWLERYRVVATHQAP